jgi:hypothetical protein
MPHFTGEPLRREVWFDWICTLNTFTWDREIDPEGWDFMGEWFRALFHGGKELGYTDFEKR